MQHYSKGFTIRRSVGNNAFSYEKRKNKEIYVSAFRDKTHPVIEEGAKPAFIEIENGEEKIFNGLKEFIKIPKENKNIYLFDNHNHAFYVIFKEVFSQSIPKGLALIHFDQHKDMRAPKIKFAELSAHQEEMEVFFRDVYGKGSENFQPFSEEDKAFYYTNQVLNVGNFIVPLIEEGIISEAVMMDSSYRLDQAKEIREKYSSYLLDIDLDFFSEEMDYISYDKKIRIIKEFMKHTLLITICTSPFFVSFDRAQGALKDLLSEYC